MNDSNNRAGLTLIEVVASLALLASLLVALLIAGDRFGSQMRAAEQRLVAIEAANQMLSSWTATEPMEIPANGGELKEQGLKWTLSGRVDRSLEGMGIQIAELKVFSAHPTEQAFPLVTIEFLTTAAIDGQRP